MYACVHVCFYVFPCCEVHQCLSRGSHAKDTPIHKRTHTSVCVTFTLTLLLVLCICATRVATASSKAAALVPGYSEQKGPSACDDRSLPSAAAAWVRVAHA